MGHSLNSQINVSEILKPVPLLRYTSAKGIIPRLYLLPFRGRMYVNVQFTSSKTEIKSLHLFLKSFSIVEHAKGVSTIHRKNEEKYSFEEKRWLCEVCLINNVGFLKAEMLSDHDIEIACSIHNKPYVNYCHQCQENMCTDCNEKHFDHPKNTLSKALYQEPKMKVFDKAKAINRRLTNALINQIQAQGNSLSHLKANIQSACDANEQINDDLKVLKTPGDKLCVEANTEERLHRHIN